MTEQVDISDRTLKWGDYSTLPSEVPAVSLLALAQRGVTHYMGNEQASKLTAWVKKPENKDATEEQVKAYAKTLHDAAWQKIMKGEMGVRSAGQPRITGIEAVMRKMATAWVSAALAKQGVKLPTGDKTVNMAGKDFTREQLIDRALKTKGDFFRAEAQKQMDEEAARNAGAGEMGDIFADDGSEDSAGDDSASDE